MKNVAVLITLMLCLSSVFSEKQFLEKKGNEEVLNITPEFIDKFVKEVDEKLTANNPLTKKINELENKLDNLINNLKSIDSNVESLTS